MALGDTSLGTGATFTFPGFVADITSMSIDGPECGVVDVTHLLSAVLHEFLPCELLQPGTIAIEGHFKSTIDVDGVVGTSGALVINTGSGNVWTWTVAIMTGFSANIPLEDAETFSANFQLASALVVT